MKNVRKFPQSTLSSCMGGLYDWHCPVRNGLAGVTNGMLSFFGSSGALRSCYVSFFKFLGSSRLLTPITLSRPQNTHYWCYLVPTGTSIRATRASHRCKPGLNLKKTSGPKPTAAQKTRVILRLPPPPPPAAPLRFVPGPD